MEKEELCDQGSLLEGFHDIVEGVTWPLQHNVLETVEKVTSLLIVEESARQANTQ